MERKSYQVAIVILNYNSWEDTLEEIRTCNEILGVKNFDIIVVDNCSPNNSAERLQEESLNKGFVFIKSNINRGYAAGNNIGLRYAFDKGYTHALILNNDIIINNSDLILKLISVFKAEKSVAVVNPDIYSPDGYLFNRDSIKPTFYDYTFGLLNYRKKGRNIEDKKGYGYVYRPQGCCMLVDLKKLKDIDYFDEKTFLYYEEPILAERLLLKGYLCVCCTTVSIIHNHSKTVKSVLNKKKIIKMKNDSFSYYLRKYRHYNPVAIFVCCLFNTLKLLALHD